MCVHSYYIHVLTQVNALMGVYIAFDICSHRGSKHHEEVFVMAALEVVGMWADEHVKDTDRWLWSLFNNKKRLSAYHTAILNWQWCQAMD